MEPDRNVRIFRMQVEQNADRKNIPSQMKLGANYPPLTWDYAAIESDAAFLRP